MPSTLSLRVRIRAAAIACVAALLLAPAAIARRPAPPAARALVPCAPLGDVSPEQPPVLRSAVGLNYAGERLAGAHEGALELCLLVDSTGVVREARVSRALAPFDSAALDAARWWVFAPARDHGRAVPARIAVSVEARLPRDADPLVPDVIALAHDAEARGDLRAAIDAWNGALARVGSQPMLQNEWTIRERILRLAARLPSPPEIPLQTGEIADGTHALILRNIARAANETYAATLDGVLRVAPWYVEAYRWRASARAACGQRDGAVRDVLCYRLAVRDSAERALADRALEALAAADTIAALTMLKN